MAITTVLELPLLTLTWTTLDPGVYPLVVGKNATVCATPLTVTVP